MPAVPENIPIELARTARALSHACPLPGCAAASLAVICMAAGVMMTGERAAAAQSGPAQQAQTAQAQSSQAPGPAIPPVTTTVLVHGDVKDNYLPETVTAGTLDGAQLSETPLSATVVTRDLLTDQVSRVLSDVVKNDASIGEDY